MERYELNDTLKTGVKMIDTHHRELIRAINDLADAIEKGMGGNAVKKILSFLEFYAEWHFAHEEKCAHKHQCPMAQVNKDAHAIFLATVKKYRVEYQENPEKQSIIALQIHHDLSQWLIGHIKGIDVKLGAEIIAAGT
ncbi:hemerythrin family protein [Cyanobacterium stanieri LEGE 03274]|uniref:Hemerythrin family protein n=1 Tax=Cyanobacterium stanieri LEGE 03274 TaxID=1828756 RepID=A0ABR9V649_9CHRO|nr:hemerythrin family protein [Cyanobacterium stanieri]MBE9223375.1 hemerythrin family protein [Cyanobacterium stanieri LEGE 03274]